MLKKKSIFTVVFISPYSVRMWKNTDQKNSECRLFSSSLIHVRNEITVTSKVTEAAVRRCSSKLLFANIYNIHWKKPVVESHFNTVPYLQTCFQACNFIKKRNHHMCFPCWYCKIFKNNFFCRTPPVAAQ